LKIFGIHSCLIKNGNMAYLINYALEEASKTKGMSMDVISIASLSFADYRHCKRQVLLHRGRRLANTLDNSRLRYSHVGLSSLFRASVRKNGLSHRPHPL